jgi:O-antigen ligase
VVVVVWIAVTVFVGATFGAMFGLISSLFSSYATDTAYGGLMQAIENAPLGMGTGTNTGAARYAVSDPSGFVGIENYYAKAAVELGIPGLLVVVGLFVVVIVAGFKAHRSIVPPVYRCCLSALLAFAIVIFLNSFKGWLIDLDPLNVYYWLFAGILLKLSVLEQAQLAVEYTEEYSLVEARTWN